MNKNHKQLDTRIDGASCSILMKIHLYNVVLTFTCYFKMLTVQISPLEPVGVTQPNRAPIVSLFPVFNDQISSLYDQNCEFQSNEGFFWLEFIKRHLMGVDQLDFSLAQPEESSATSGRILQFQLSVGWGE